MMDALRYLMKPDFTIYNDRGMPSLKRWHLLRLDRVQVYLHNHCGDDRGPMHDHPRNSLSLCLSGGYWEVLPTGVHRRKPWRFLYRRATQAHRIKRLTDRHGNPRNAWTIFITGPRVREWGFLCPNGWRHWREFTDPNDPGKMGKGCE